MISNIYTSDQTTPFIFANKLLKTNDVKKRLIKYIECLQNNNIDPKDMKSVLATLKESGCTYAFVANALVESFLKDNNYQYDDKKFQDLYGLSIEVDEDTIDSSILMVDIFSKLYNLSRFDINKYNKEIYKNTLEAAKSITGIDYTDSSKAYLDIINHGYIADGITATGEHIYKKQEPTKLTIVGTYDDVAKKLLGVETEGISKRELESELNNKGITFFEKDKNPAAKFSGLTTNEINFWVNYYLSLKGNDLSFTSTIYTSNDEDFPAFIEEQRSQSIVGVAAPLNNNIMMIDPKTKSSSPITSNTSGHIMTFRGFNQNGDIMVDSYGKDFILRRSDIDKLEFQVVDIKHKTNNLEQTEEYGQVIK